MNNFAQGGNLGTFDILFIMMFWTYPEKISLVPFFSGSNSNALGLLGRRVRGGVGTGKAAVKSPGWGGAYNNYAYWF